MYLFGEIAIELHLITVGQLRHALKVQAELRGRDEHKLIGMVLVELGYIAEADIPQILAAADEAQDGESDLDVADTVTITDAA
ncbi:MAG: hypothetical protein ACYS22_07060 [Planctomycetota bacterium]|jgi:hypothetical protein